MTVEQGVDERQLLAGLIDYAGLFPPAALPMADAVANWAQYHRSGDSWALGRFVVPASRLAELDAAAEPHRSGIDPARPWLLSALVTSARDVEAALRHAASNSLIWVDTLEGRAASVADVAIVAGGPAATMTRFVEAPLGDGMETVLDAIARYGACAKIRMGGVVAEAFPDAAEIVRFLRACHARRLPFKATAGLHHWIRGEYALTYEPMSARAVMYGYLNVLLAAAVVAAGGPARDAEVVLLARSVRPHADGYECDGVVVPSAAVAMARNFMRGVGSCSFREPFDESRFWTTRAA